MRQIIEDWVFSNGHILVVRHWQLKPGVQGSILGNYFPLFLQHLYVCNGQINKLKCCQVWVTRLRVACCFSSVCHGAAIVCCLTPAKKKKKGAGGILSRPIICICNDQ